MAELLLELYSEEIPPQLQISARSQIKQFIENTFKEENIKYKELLVYSSPTRLTLFIKDLTEKIKKVMEKTKRPIIIFPQATRVLPDEIIPFKKGVGRIYRELNVKCQPVAIDSGRVWPKSGNMIPNKTITISILKPINTGIEETEFVKLLQKEIYSELGLAN